MFGAAPCGPSASALTGAEGLAPLTRGTWNMRGEPAFWMGSSETLKKEHHSAPFGGCWLGIPAIDADSYCAAMAPRTLSRDPKLTNVNTKEQQHERRHNSVRRTARNSETVGDHAESREHQTERLRALQDAEPITVACSASLKRRSYASSAASTWKTTSARYRVAPGRTRRAWRAIGRDVRAGSIRCSKNAARSIRGAAVVNGRRPSPS